MGARFSLFINETGKRFLSTGNIPTADVDVESM